LIRLRAAPLALRSTRRPKPFQNLFPAIFLRARENFTDSLLLRETRTVPESHVQAKGQARQV
jgi:hypothetical protein